MACEGFEQDLSACVDGELTGPARARLEAHLHSCLQCRELMQQLQQTSSYLRQMGVPRAPSHLTDAALEIVRTMPRQAVEPLSARFGRIFSELFFPKFAIPAIGLVAAVLIAVVVGRQEFDDAPYSDSSIASSQTIGSSDRSQLAEGTGPAKGPAPASADGNYRLTSAPAKPDDEYDFRDPKTHGRRDIGEFDDKERLAWQQGTWRHERRFGRDGWWWVLGRVWYWYGESANGPPNYASEFRIVNPLPPTDTGTPGSAVPRP